ncbi:MAG: isocitrate lyase/phosphoenolpyruvate mutase family protein [Alphaproteobacteria bacterium]|nr:MAG: isocitrate lyase/phosphoenolpyruvate mutase family protein [Alphaproteobacteria bacterium]
MTDSDKCHLTFRQLHDGPGAFIIPNPYDIGTARILAALGFKALATTSAGYAFGRGRKDNNIGRDEMMAHVREIVTATALPVSADLENGFGNKPEDAADTIRQGIAAGLAGGSIEDSINGMQTGAQYDIGLAKDRIVAAIEAARNAPDDFVLTARAENYLVGNPDLGDTIRRLQAYQEAGADVLYAPGLRSRQDIEAVVSSVDRPVNVVMGLQGVQLDLETLSAIGVRRISVGSALSRAALGAFLRAAREMQGAGTFGFAEAAVPYPEISTYFD